MKETLKLYYRNLAYRKRFNEIARQNKLSIDFAPNAGSFATFQSIFMGREYADFFPFYKTATVLDVGAHYGYFSLFASLNLSEQSRIVSIEPSFSNFIVLQENVRRSRLANIETLNVGVSGTTGAIKLFKSTSVNNSIFQEVAHSASEAYETIESMRLEDVFVENNVHTVDFLKMD